MFTFTIIKGKILLLSGLHIGGNKDGVEIGGMDNPVIKNPLTKEPYIPGSSLKGKIRFLLEHAKNVASQDGGNIPKYRKDSNELIPTVFGHTEHSTDINTYPTRVVFRDSNIIGAVKDLSKEPGDSNFISKEEAFERMELTYTEEKTEVVIDRLSGTVSKKGGPRPIERVPAGMIFEFEISIRAFFEDEIKNHNDLLLEGLKLLQNDSLGGSGSRGSGRIKFFDITVNGEPVELRNSLN